MNENPMTEQVNRLIGNRLAAGCELFLPGVGSLYTDQRGARRVSKRMVEPPCRVVLFTPQERGASLVDEIAGAARCDVDRAQSIYDRWLDNVLGENTLTIDGVGELRFRNFTPDEEFDLLLNPQGHAPVKMRSGGRDWAVWVGLLAIVAALGIGYMMFVQKPAFLERFGLNPDEEQYEPAASEVAAPALGDDSVVAGQPAVSEPADNRTTSAPDDGRPIAPAVGQNPTPEPTAAPAAPAPGLLGTAQAPASLVSGHHYVVAGVFASPENADRTAEEINRQDPALQCTVFRFGSKLMVSPFQSADPEACRRFVRDHRVRWRDAWIYTAR